MTEHGYEEEIAPQGLRGSGYLAQKYVCSTCESQWVVVFEEWSIAVSRHAAFATELRAFPSGAAARDTIPLVRGLYGHTANEEYPGLVNSGVVAPTGFVSFISYMKALKGDT